MDKEFKMALERMDRLSDEIGRIKRALTAHMEGVPFNEAFDEELYQEASDRKARTNSFLGRMIEHLLKLAYCSSEVGYNYNKKDWISAVRRYHENAIIEMNWGRKPDRNVVNDVEHKLQDIYDNGIYFYERAAKEYPDLQDGLKLIPERCPWTLKELMEDTINELLEKLPNKFKREG